jgi:hypothetical protein
MGKSTKTSRPATETAALKVSGSHSILVASAGDDYIPPLLGYTDDDFVDNPRINPMLALTGGIADADDEPGRLPFLNDYVPRMPAAPGLLLVGGYDVPRLNPFPNPASSGLNLFGGSQLDPTGGSSLNNNLHAMNNTGGRPDLNFTPSAPASINPAAQPNYPRPTPGLAQPMPNPQGAAPGAFAQSPAQSQASTGAVAPGNFAQPAPQGQAGQAPAYGGPPPGYAGGPLPYAGGQPEMLAYAGTDLNNPALAQGHGYPQAGYPQAAQNFAPQGYQGGFAQAAYGAQPGYGYQPGCTNCGNGQNFGAVQFPSQYGNFGAMPQYASTSYAGHYGHGMNMEYSGAPMGGYQGGFSPVSAYSGGSFGGEMAHGGFGGFQQGFGGCQPSFGCCPPSFGCCPQPVSCCMPTSYCGSSMGSFSGGCCGPIESYGCCPPGCGPKKGLFGRLKDWFKGGSRGCNDYDSCYEQPKCGLFSRFKNLFKKKKDCYPAPMYYGCSTSCSNYGGYEGGFEGGFGGGFGGGCSEGGF